MGIQSFGGELPFFFLSGWILRKIGHVNAMSLVLFAFGVRFILYSVLVDPWWVLPIEMLNGVTFGIFYSTMASYASIVAPRGTEATMQVSVLMYGEQKTAAHISSTLPQGLVGAIFEGVGVSMGSLIAGNLFAAVSGSGTFLIFGIFAFIAFIVHVLVQWYLQRIGQGAADANGKQTVVDNVTQDVIHFPEENGKIWTVSATNPKGVDAEFTDVDLN